MSCRAHHVCSVTTSCGPLGPSNAQLLLLNETALPCEIAYHRSVRFPSSKVHARTDATTMSYMNIKWHSRALPSGALDEHCMSGRGPDVFKFTVFE